MYGRKIIEVIDARLLLPLSIIKTVTVYEEMRCQMFTEHQVIEV